MQVIGLCRFSYPALGGFQIEHDSIEQRRAFLYAPARMEERFALFEGFTLPALRAQTDPDFTFLIVIGDDLPAPYRARLDALTRDVAQVVIQSHAPGRHRDVMQQAINSVRIPSAEPSLQFRLDDDDAVSLSYIEALRYAAHEHHKLLRDERHIAIDFNQGFLARPSMNGIEAAPSRARFMTAALALMIKPEVPLTVMNFSHSRLQRFMPCVIMGGSDMYVRSHNTFNDSRMGKRPMEMAPLSAEQEAHFKQTFAIDADEIRRLFRDVPPVEDSAL